MNLKALRDLTAEILVAHPTQPNASFTNSRINRALNRRYKFEIGGAQLEGLRNHFRRRAELEWPVDQVTLTLPQELQGQVFERVEDVTDQDPGAKLNIASRPDEGRLFWRERNILQWGRQGPTSDKTLALYFLAKPEDLLNDDAEPLLIPDAYRPVLAWSAAIELISMANQRVPPDWQNMLDAYRLDWHKSLTLGNPMDYPPTVVYTDGYTWVLAPA